MTQEARHSKGNPQARAAIVWTGAGQLTSRSSATGISHSTGFRDAGTQYNPHAEILLPAGSIASPVSVLKSLNLTQAVLDGLAAVFWIFFLAALAGSLPLAVALMVLGAL